MHELGHLIDFNNQINSRSSATTWSRFSWVSADTPLKHASFAYRDDFCFYDCDRYLKSSQAKEIYTSLRESDFPTTYAAVNNFEDFAEYWTWHLIRLEKDPSFTIEIPGEVTLVMNDVFVDNPRIKTKMDYIGKLWNSADLRIDNRSPAGAAPLAAQ